MTASRQSAHCPLPHALAQRIMMSQEDTATMCSWTSLLLHLASLLWPLALVLLQLGLWYHLWLALQQVQQAGVAVPPEPPLRTVQPLIGPRGAAAAVVGSAAAACCAAGSAAAGWLASPVQCCRVLRVQRWQVVLLQHLQHSVALLPHPPMRAVPLLQPPAPARAQPAGPPGGMTSPDRCALQQQLLRRSWLPWLLGWGTRPAAGSAGQLVFQSHGMPTTP
jgi:hypothetical protein